MIKKTQSGNRKSIITGWNKVSYEDVTRFPLQASISVHACSLVKEFAKNLGISEARFVEQAITSATIGNNNWEFASRRFDRIKKERSYMKMLRVRLIKQQDKESGYIKPEISEVKEVFERIVNEDIKGKALEELLSSKGLAFISKNTVCSKAKQDEKEEG